MKFSLKVLNRIKSDLKIDPNSIGSAIDNPTKLFKIAQFAIDADADDSREPGDCTAAEVIEAWARDAGFDIVKKLTAGLPQQSENAPE
jgi:hypothetical protein